MSMPTKAMMAILYGGGRSEGKGIATIEFVDRDALMRTGMFLELERWIKHLPNCERISKLPCSCGLDDKIAALRNDVLKEAK